MLSHKKFNSPFLIIGALFLVFISIGISYAAYDRLKNRMNKNQVLLHRFESILKESISEQNKTISLLSRQNNQPAVTIKENSLNNNEHMIKQINAQNNVIEEMLDQYGSLHEQVALLQRQITSSDNLLSEVNPDGYYSDISDDLFQQPITIEDLEKEANLEKKLEEESSQKTEVIFQSQPQGGIWAAETNLKIQNAIDKIRLDQKFSDLNISNVDCREFMCKFELSNADSQIFEGFDLLFLNEVLSEQPGTTTVFSKSLENGNTNNTYYLSTN